MTTFAALINDESGFIVSAELVLVSTIAVLGMIVGLSEVALRWTPLSRPENEFY